MIKMDDNRACITAYVTTSYQILIASYIVIEIKKHFGNLKSQLIYDAYLKGTLEYYSEEIWDDYIEFNVYNHCVDWHCYNIFKGNVCFYENNKKLISALESMNGKLQETQIIIFSSGDSIVPYHLKKKYNKALFVLFSDGLASYKEGLSIELENRIIREKKLIWKFFIYFVRKLYDAVFKYNFPKPSDLLICGNNDVDIYMDFNINMARDVFKLNRINYEISIEKVKSVIDKIISDRCQLLFIEIESKKIMLFFSQCFAEDNKYPIAWDVDYIKRINKFCKEKGYDLLVKPHPRDSVQKINSIKNICRVEDSIKMLPFEILCMKSSFECLATVSSSTIINAYNLHASKEYIVFEEDYIKYLKGKGYDGGKLSVSNAFNRFYKDRKFKKGYTIGK